jgi:hypothetical protein
MFKRKRGRTARGQGIQSAAEGSAQRRAFGAGFLSGVVRKKRALTLNRKRLMASACIRSLLARAGRD